MSAQTSFINNLLDAAFDGGTYTGGAITMGLFKTGTPSTNGVEVSSSGYERQTIDFGSATGGSISSSANVVFNNLGTSDTIVAWGVYDGTTLIDEGTLATPFTATISTNELKVSYKFSLG